MEAGNSLHYLELSQNPIRFDSVSQLTNVFFDDSNKQVFAVRSGGATGIVVKGPSEDAVISFCMSNRGDAIRSIKFSPDNKILAVQRKENAVEFICFQGDQLQDVIVHQVKALIYGFVWVQDHECALIANNGVEIFTVLPEKRQIRSVKALSLSIKWFAWSSDANVALLCTTESNTLIPVLIKQKAITKLPKVEMGGSSNSEVEECKVTLGQVYGVMAVLILQLNATTGLMEVEVYLLNGPGLAPRKCHMLRLGHKGRFAINTVDNLIVVHHQASATSLLFDIALSGEIINNITYHAPIITGRSIKPFGLKIPTLSPDGQILQCELYSTHWVLFQPNIVIDAKMGCMWYLNLCIEPLCTLISDRIRLTKFLLQRSNAKPVLLNVIKQLVDEQYNGSLLPVLETIFDNINKVYASWVHAELQTQTAQPSNVKQTSSSTKQTAPPKVLIEQSDMQTFVFDNIAERSHTETILMLYLQSLSKHNIAAQEELSKMLINELIRNRSFDTLRRLVSYSLLLESKSTACYLLAHSDVDAAISQVALDMLGKIKAYEIIIEVLLGQGKVIDALRMAKTTLPIAKISARKFLEAAMKTKDDLIFYSVFKYFQMRNMRQYETLAFPKSEQCTEFLEHYNNLFPTDTATTPQPQAS